MTNHEFKSLLLALADCWQRHDYTSAVARFAPNVRYGDPVRYAVTGRDKLQAFFENDDGLPQLTTWHTILFDEEKQSGAAEYSYTGTHTYHGVVLIKLKKDQISGWREYQYIDSRTWSEFKSTTNFDE